MMKEITEVFLSLTVVLFFLKNQNNISNNDNNALDLRYTVIKSIIRSHCNHTLVVVSYMCNRSCPVRGQNDNGSLAANLRQQPPPNIQSHLNRTTLVKCLAHGHNNRLNDWAGI